MGCSSSKPVADDSAMMRRRARGSMAMAGLKTELAKDSAQAAEATRVDATNGSVVLRQPPGVGLGMRYAYISQRGYYPDAPDKTNQDAVAATERLGGQPGEGAGTAARCLHRVPCGRLNAFAALPLSCLCALPPLLLPRRWRCCAGAGARHQLPHARPTSRPPPLLPDCLLPCYELGLLPVPRLPADLHLFSVYDGHGELGTECARFVRDGVRSRSCCACPPAGGMFPGCSNPAPAPFLAALNKRMAPPTGLGEPCMLQELQSRCPIRPGPLPGAWPPSS